MKYNLEKRVLEFSKSVLRIKNGVKIDKLNESLFDQLFRSATSVGANYFEANGSSSKKKILETRSIFVRKKQKKPPIG